MRLEVMLAEGAKFGARMEVLAQSLSATVRYGSTTLDLPSLQAWLRSRLEGHWQPPTLIKSLSGTRSN